MKVINLWGSPGAGKSTVAAGLFYKMKMADYNVELISEFAKDIQWEGHSNIFLDQLYIFAQQNRKLERLRGKVDYCINDSPLLMQLAYRQPDYYSKFNELVEEVWNSYDNSNFLLQRTHAYRTAGRWHSEEQASDVERDIRSIISYYEQNVTYITSPDPAEYIFERVKDNDL